MFRVQPLGVFGAAAAFISAVGCAAGPSTTHAASLPDSGSVVRPNDHANRVVSRRAQQYVAQLGAARDRSVEQNINDAAAHGARVFRVPIYVVWDPTTRSTYFVPKSDIRQTAQGVVVELASGPKALSRDAKVDSKPQYTYTFAHGSESDPDPSTDAVRVK